MWCEAGCKSKVPEHLGITEESCVTHPEKSRREMQNPRSNLDITTHTVTN